MEACEMCGIDNGSVLCEKCFIDLDNIIRCDEKDELKVEKRAHEATARMLEQVRAELATAKRQLHQHTLQQMQDIAQRRAAAMEQHRQNYERAQYEERLTQQCVRNTDDGEDEID